jgi:VWFA-related protein
MRRRFAWIWIVPALSVFGAAAPQTAEPAETKPFVECNSDELTHALPELTGMQFDFNQDRLDGLLRKTGEDLLSMFAKPLDISATEQIHEMRFEDGMGEAGRRETYRYLVRLLGKDSLEPLDELRVEPENGAPVPAPTADFLVISHFENLLRTLLPQVREESRFRYLGRTRSAGQDSWLVAFAQRAGGEQGLMWIDAATHRIVRLRTDVSGRSEGLPLETLTTDIAVVPVKFPSLGTVFWLPARVTVHGRYAGGEMHSVHRYSDYRLSGSVDAGIPAATVSNADDPWEMLDRSISLVRENQPAESIALLREALRLDPEMAPARYHLAATLREAGDSDGAEAELREAVRRSPNPGPAHNFLGILLFKRGDLAGATAELRASAQLQPKDAAVHFNLAQALEKADTKAALDEYRLASTLAPDNAVFRARYEHFQHASNAAAAPDAAGTTIKVEVRQVLVPVVVTDQQGHHVTGLTPADFRVFEDGVEQKISGFSVENIDSAGSPPPVPAAIEPAGAAAALVSPAAAPVPKPAAVRRTYLICIDSLHSQFSNLVNVRAALSRLFASEQAGDARYVMVAVGTSTKVLQSPTTDPATVLKAIESEDFQKLFLESRRMGEDLQAFQRDLDEARKACDNNRPECVPMAKSLPFRASQIASQDHTVTAAFLEQLRYLVEDLSRETGRRTMVLLSDGFLLIPGKQVFDLLEAYFPNAEGSFRREDRMTNLDAILRVAAKHNISIHTINSRGLETQNYFGSAGTPGPVMLGIMNNINGVAWEAGGTLEDIAAATGGTAFKNNNDLLAGLERAFADGRQYYVLAYVPSNATSDGTFRAISVRVRDGKLSVHAKRGYWAEGNPAGR